MRPKDIVNPTKQDGVVHKILCDWGQVHIGENNAGENHGPRQGDIISWYPNPRRF